MSMAFSTAASTSTAKTASTPISTILFDVDDTLYDVSSGFTAHRNGDCVHQYMVDHLRFSSLQHAKEVRDAYFAKYHATAKALTVAQAEGKFPEGAPVFDTKHLAQHWAENCDYSLLGPSPNKKLLQDLLELKQEQNLQLVAFSNGPRAYVQAVLEYLGLWTTVFQEDTLFAVDDVLPYCKPEPEAFEKIFRQCNIDDPSSCLMVEDSMKNLRCAKALGMQTLLITGSEEVGRILPEDAPSAEDPAVDAAIAVIEDLKTALPGLWESPAVLIQAATAA